MNNTMKNENSRKMRYTLAKPLYYMEYTPDMKISMSKGNEKIGKSIWNISTLPGDKQLVVTKDNLGVLTNVVGTCGGCCDGCKDCCYAVHDAKRHHNVVIKAWGRNTLIMRHNINEYFSQIQERIIKDKIKLLRFHVGGEIPSKNYLEHMARLAINNPETIMYFYTKRFKWVEEYLADHGQFPDNLYCNISRWHGNTDGHNFGNCNIFAYDDGGDEGIKTGYIRCPAVKKEAGEKKGHRTKITCSQCGLCFSKHGLHIKVYNH